MTGLASCEIGTVLSAWAPFDTGVEADGTEPAKVPYSRVTSYKPNQYVYCR